MEIWNLISKESLVYTDSWGSAESAVKAKVFEKMIDLSRDVVKYYVSDLYHDAVWINNNVTGPMDFDWIPRESGTFIGDTARNIDRSYYEDGERYRFEIVNEDGRFILNTYHAVEHAGEVKEEEFVLSEEVRPYFEPIETLVPLRTNVADDDVSCTGYKGVYGLQHDGDTCPVHELSPLEEIEDCGDDSACDEPRCPSYRKYEDSDGTFTEDDQGNWHQVNDGTWVVDNDPLKEIISALFEPNNPTSRNNEQGESPRKDVNRMDNILDDLRTKLDEANSAKEELDDARSELDDKIDELDNYISEVDSLIDSLERLPEVSVYFEVNVSFDS